MSLLRGESAAFAAGLAFNKGLKPKANDPFMTSKSAVRRLTLPLPPGISRHLL
jgi:hypothetical protein